MCIDTIEVCGVTSAREAYEVSEFLKGMDYIDDARCDEINNRLVVDYDETMIDRDEVLDRIERAGCQPSERRTGLLSSIRHSVGV